MVAKWASQRRAALSDDAVTMRAPSGLKAAEVTALALDGEDLRGLPLSLRKTNLARLLARKTGQRLRRAVLDQGEEPEASCDEPGDGGIRLSATSITSNCRVSLRVNPATLRDFRSSDRCFDSPCREHAS